MQSLILYFCIACLDKAAIGREVSSHPWSSTCNERDPLLNQLRFCFVAPFSHEGEKNTSVSVSILFLKEHGTARRYPEGSFLVKEADVVQHKCLESLATVSDPYR